MRSYTGHSRAPENPIEFTVGLLLVAFGTFWSGEGIGVEWSLGDITIPVLAVLYAAVSFGLIVVPGPEQKVGHLRQEWRREVRLRFRAVWYAFIVGGSVVLAIGSVAVLAVGAVLVRSSAASSAEFTLPAIVVATLVLSLRAP